jgi:hypothetical protein
MSLHFCTGVLNCLYVSLNLCNVCSTTVSWIVFKCLYMSARVRLELSWYVCNGNETCMLIIRMNCFEVCMRQRMLSISYVHLLGIYALWRTFAALWLCWVEECWDFSIITNTPRKFPPFLIWLRVGLMTIQCGPPSFKSSRKFMSAWELTPQSSSRRKTHYTKTKKNLYVVCSNTRSHGPWRQGPLHMSCAG